MGAGGSFYFWLGASADADPALVSDQAASRLAPSGFDPLRIPHWGDGTTPCHVTIGCEHDWEDFNPFDNHYPSGTWCPKCGEHSA